MSTRKPLLRSRTSQKMVDIKLDKYKPRDWDYLSIKHQIIPHFVLGRSKKRVANPAQKEFSIFVNTIKPRTNIEFKRELKPAVYRSYILSQIATVPGAVLVEESKINDQQKHQNLIKVVKNKNLCYLNKLENEYGSNVAFLPGSKDTEIQKGHLFKSKTLTNFNFKPKKKIEIAPTTKKEVENEKVSSPIRNRIKRNKKLVK